MEFCVWLIARKICSTYLINTSEGDFNYYVITKEPEFGSPHSPSFPFDFGNPPPANIQNFTSTHTHP